MKNRKPTQRIPKSKLAPKAMTLRAKGWTHRAIAEHLGRSERYIYELLAWAKGSSNQYDEIPDPIAFEDLKLEVLPTREFTPEGFKAFFERYSGRMLADVHFDWVQKAIGSLNKRILINCPPRHAKSTIFSVWFPIWLVTMDRNTQIIICSQTVDLAKKFANEINAHLTGNEKLLAENGRYRPEGGDWPWRPLSGQMMVEGRTRTSVSGDLTFQIRGAKQQILGMEADWVIADDVVDRPAAVSKQERKTLSEWFHGDVLTRLQPGGYAVVIGQRLHLRDLYGELSEEVNRGSLDKRWEHINYPAVLDWEAKTVLWPDVWPFEELMERHTDLGSTLFSAMFQQDPLPEGERLIRDEWIFGDLEHLGCLDVLRGAGEQADVENRVRVISLDPGTTRYWGLIVGDLSYNRYNFDFRILEIDRGIWNVRTAIEKLESAHARYEPQYLIIERNAARHFLQNPNVEELMRKMKFISHDTGRNKADPVLGIQSIAVDFEFGRVRLPHGDAEAKVQTQLLLDEALTYPQGDTDDLLMALWFVKFNFKRLVPRATAGNARASTAYHVPPRLSAGFEVKGGDKDIKHWVDQLKRKRLNELTV